MNLVELDALKVGDRIDNAMSNSTGEVVGADRTGVTVKWSGERLAPGGQTGIGTTRHYSVASTIWFHWSKIDDEVKSDQV